MIRLHRLVNGFGGPAGFLGALIVIALLVMAVGAPWIAPRDPLLVDISNQLLEPGGQFPFGTDQSGRDVLSRVIWGTRASLSVSAIAVVIGMAGGVTLGLIAGFYRGGWIEQITVRFLEAISAIPILIWAIALVGIFGVGDMRVGPFVLANEAKLMILLGLLYIPTLARVTYTTALVQSQANFVLARRLQGTGGLRIMVSDVLPNCLSPVIRAGHFATGDRHHHRGLGQLRGPWRAATDAQLGQHAGRTPVTTSCPANGGSPSFPAPRSPSPW